MAVPKKRTSRRRRGMRRAHDFLVASAATEACPECGELKLRHCACDACGTYTGVKLMAAEA